MALKCILCIVCERYINSTWLALKEEVSHAPTHTSSVNDCISFLPLEIPVSPSVVNGIAVHFMR